MSEERITCPRCGFTVNLEGASEKGRYKLTGIAEDHAAICPTLPGSTERAEARAARREAAWEALKERRQLETADERRLRRAARRFAMAVGR